VPRFTNPPAVIPSLPGDEALRLGLEPRAPEGELLLGVPGMARAIREQPSGDNERFCDSMVEHNQAAVKSNVTIRQFQVVGGAARQPGLDECSQVVTPVAETAAEREREVRLLQQFIP
jgi:hypothetical protein